MKYIQTIIIAILATATLNATVNIPTTISQEAQIELQNISTWMYEDTNYEDIDKANLVYGNIEYRLNTPKHTLDETKIIIYVGDAYHNDNMGDNFASYLAHHTHYITYFVKRINSQNLSYLENFIKTIKANSNKKIIAIGNITGSYLLMNYLDNTNYFYKVILISMFANDKVGDTYNLQFKDGSYFRNREHQSKYIDLKEVPKQIFSEDKTIKNDYVSLPDVMFITGTKDFAYSDTLRTANYMEHQFINNVKTYILEGMWTNFIQHDIPERDKLLIQIQKFISN